jgi:predicted DNA-binding protein
VLQKVGIMADTINARIPPGVRQRLAEYCAKQGVTRSEVVVRALDRYLERADPGSGAYALAADLIPEKGVDKLQSENARALARRAFSGSRSR